MFGNNSASIKKIGLLTGEGTLPVSFALRAKKRGVKVVAFAVRGHVSEKLEGVVEKLHLFGWNELSRLYAAIKKEKIRHAVLLGRIRKSYVFNNESVADKGTNKLFSYFRDKRDYALLKSIARLLTATGIRLLNATTFFEDSIPAKGTLTKRKPTARELKDISFGRSVARTLARFDIGQTVCVNDMVVLAMEGPEGTDGSIKRAGSLGRDGMVAVKMARPRQDMRLDVPLIGTETIQALIESRAKVLAVEAGKTMFLEKEKVIDLANRSDITIIGV
ncbi:MAG: UDP-2,3-diacylglucosamine diphosphatase LpxI [Candidatus Omnitrophota bacterium]